jgi:predicted MFS family arabinose efflux permease
VVGEGWCFLLNAASYLAVIAALLRIRGRVPRRAGVGAPSLLGHIGEGIRFAAWARPIRALLLLVGVMSLFGMPYSLLMPLFADRVLGAGARGLGLLMGATGVGALVGALLLALRAEVRGLGRWVVASAMAFGVLLVLFALSRTLTTAMAALFGVGLCMVVQTASANTLLQTLSPDEMRGRVMSLFSMMFLGMAPFGAFLAGAAASRLGAPAAVAAGGVVCALAASVLAFRLPSLRAEARELVAAQQLAGAEPPDQVVGAQLVER